MAADIQFVYKLILVFLYSFFATYWISEHLIPKFKKAGYVVKDMYKRDKPLIANMGGMAIFSGIMVSLVLSQIIIKDFSIEKLLIFYFIPIVFGTFGFLDDLINVGQRWKIIAPFFMALPISLLVSDTTFSLYFFEIELGIAYIFLVAPLYLMIVTNLVNMHSGYNGLSSGLSAIVLIFLGIRVITGGNIEDLIYLMPILGAVLAYWLFDRYPTRFIWGNVGSLMVGAAMGGYIILSNQEFFGAILLTPHIIDFCFYAFLKITKRKYVKFGKVRKDGTLKVPNPYKMKFLLPYFFRMDEKQATYFMFGLTILFGIIGLIIA